MRTRFFRFTLCSVTVCLTLFTPRTTVEANLNVGEPRTVRMIYFLPNDRPYRADVVQRMKDEIRFVQRLYAQQMQVHGYGNVTFRLETDAQGEPMVHRVDGQHPDSHYINKHRDEISGAVFDQLTQTFDLYTNIYVVLLDNSRNTIGGRGGVGGRRGKNGGEVLIAGNFGWKTLTHELGHAFGLEHNFNDGAYIMSYGTASYGPEWYGPEQNEFSACSAEFLAAHPYFNPNTQIEHTRPIIELISPHIYPAGSKNVPIKLKVNDSEGLHQAILFVRTSRNLHWARGFLEVKVCHGLTGEKEATVEFDYDGVMPSEDITNLSTPRIHPIVVQVVDVNGNMSRSNFILEEDTSLDTTMEQDMEVEVHIPNPNLRARIYDLLAYFIGKPQNEPIFREDMQAITSCNASDLTNDLTGLEFATNLRALWLDGNRITDVSALSELPYLRYLNLERNNITDVSTLVPDLSGLKDLELHLSRNSISDISSMAGLTSLPKLYLGQNLISDISVVADLTNLTTLYLTQNSISDISALTGLTNLEWLYFSDNSVSDISTLLGLTNLKGLYLGNNLVSDISALAGLTNLKGLWLGGNRISDISALAGLTNLKWLYLWHNSVSDISALAGLANLTELALGGNRISDISALAGLTLLEDLNLQENLILDVSALAGLPRLKYLNLDDNNISNISGMINLIHLDTLSLHNNSISDISTLANLSNLRSLRMYNNSISDLSPLVANIGLGSRSYVDVRRNPLNYASIYTHIPALQARGVRVDFNNRIPTKLVKISGDRHVAPSTSLPIILEVQDERGYGFEGVPDIVFAINEGNGTLSITSVVTDKNGRAESMLTLGPDLGTYTIMVSASEIGQSVTFTVVVKEDVLIPDSNLRYVIETALGKTPGTKIVPSELSTLRRLQASRVGISDLTGLESATNLRDLSLVSNNISDISVLARLTKLTTLTLGNNSISDISAIAGLTSLTWLDIGYNSISDISAVAGLTQLDNLVLRGNLISDISAVAGLTNLTSLSLGPNPISDISAVAGLVNLTSFSLSDNPISDLSPLAGLTNLRSLYLYENNVSDISPLAGLINLDSLYLYRNNVSDISPLAGLTNLTGLHISGNNISDISALANLTKLVEIDLDNNKVSDISALENLIQLRELDLSYNYSRLDLSVLVANTGLGDGDYVSVRGNQLTYSSIYTHIPALQNRGVEVNFEAPTSTRILRISGNNQYGVSFAPLPRPFTIQVQGEVFEEVPVTFTVTSDSGTLSVTEITTDKNGRAESTLTLGPNLGTHTVEVSAANAKESVTFTAISDELPTEYLWSIPSGINLIHVPLKITTVDGVETTIESISDLYDALGSTDSVNVLVTYDYSGRGWVSYASPQDRDTAADRPLTDDMGIIAILANPVTLRLQGTPLGTNESSTITLKQGTNLVGIPLKDSRITRVSDLFTIDGIRDNVIAIIVSDGGEFKAVGRAGDDGDIPIIGGQSFLLNVRADATVTISGSGWYNASGTQSAPLMTIKGIEVGSATPVLAMRGSIANERIRTNKANFRVIAKNLSTGRAVTAITANEGLAQSEGVSYQLTFVDTETARAAQVGDILEISAQSTEPLIGIQPFQYIVTTENVKQSRIELNDLIAYEIPAETKLLVNYPNPFNPETWIPYRLAEDANVVLTIYDSGGRTVRSLDVGHRKAAVYETRDKAIYWDGRNQVGERVASGVYFYHLSVGDYSAIKRMVILK